MSPEVPVKTRTDVAFCFLTADGARASGFCAMMMIVIFFLISELLNSWLTDHRCTKYQHSPFEKIETCTRHIKRKASRQDLKLLT